MDKKQSAADIPKLDSETVHNILIDCLFKEGEDHTDFILTENVQFQFGLHPARLLNHKAAIAALCDQLPEGFKEGWTFLNACVTKDGVQWGEHANVDELLALGIATGKISLLLAREYWASLPGQMPYFRVNNYNNG